MKTQTEKKALNTRTHTYIHLHKKKGTCKHIHKEKKHSRIQTQQHERVIPLLTEIPGPRNLQERVDQLSEPVAR